ncbi:MAG: hypothetical protein JSR82_14075 [Verrucomicrobia bacterium]|nr:hypothetical protein [Verrucomicrobiota bacterium]
MSSESLLRLVFAGNVVVAGAAGGLALCFPAWAGRAVFSGAVGNAALVQIIGAFWTSIAVLSVVGLWRPWTFWPLLLLQLLYKGGWLLAVFLPWLAQGRPQPFPGGVAAFFVVWVVVLPWVIPWSRLAAGE